jgi:hypothetical protein
MRLVISLAALQARVSLALVPEFLRLSVVMLPRMSMA